MKYIPDILTLCRMIGAAALLCLPEINIAFFAVYLFCGLTDVLDGVIARKIGAVSAVGARLDSLADCMLIVVCAIKFLPMLTLPIALWIWIGTIAAAKIAGMLLRHRRRGEIAVPHTVLNRLTGIVLFILPFVGRWIDLTVLSIIACAAATPAALQDISAASIR